MDAKKIVAKLLEESGYEVSEQLYEVPTVRPVDLSDGTYQGFRYGYALEIDGVPYKTTQGVRFMKEHCGGPEPVEIRSGKSFLHIRKWVD